MPATFVIVPQWQGSVSSRAMSHADGAIAIAEDLPASASVVVEVPVEAGESLDTGVHRFSTLRRVRELSAAALEQVSGTPITIGGDCGVSLAAVAHASAAASAGSGAADLALLWLDAHPDLNSPETSPSGAFNGMVLRAIAGEGAEGLALEPDLRMPADRIVLGGVRDVDEGEQAFIDEHRVTMLDVERLADPDAVVAALAATGASRVFVHLDLDVLDPSAIAGLSYPLPFGVDPAALATTLRAVVARFPLAGATIAGFTPKSPDAATDDLPTILRLVAALTSALAPARAPTAAGTEERSAASGSAD